jgi:hypothetical protein
MLLGKDESFIEQVSRDEEVPLPPHVEALLNVDQISSELLSVKKTN